MKFNKSTCCSKIKRKTLIYLMRDFFTLSNLTTKFLGTRSQVPGLGILGPQFRLCPSGTWFLNTSAFFSINFWILFFCKLLKLFLTLLVFFLNFWNQFLVLLIFSRKENINDCSWFYDVLLSTGHDCCNKYSHDNNWLLKTQFPLMTTFSL